MIFSSVRFVISHLPSFNPITAASLAAAVMSSSYSTIAWVLSWHKGVQPDVQYTSRASTNTGQMFQLQCSRRYSFCLRRAQCGVGDPSNNPFHTREAFQETNVERSGCCLCCCRFVLLTR